MKTKREGVSKTVIGGIAMMRSIRMDNNCRSLRIEEDFSQIDFRELKKRKVMVVWMVSRAAYTSRAKIERIRSLLFRKPSANWQNSKRKV